jgi:hypothetical protein
MITAHPPQDVSKVVVMVCLVGGSSLEIAEDFWNVVSGTQTDQEMDVVAQNPLLQQPDLQFSALAGEKLL